MDLTHAALIVAEAIVSGIAIFKVIDFMKLSSAFPWFTKERVELIRTVNLALSALAVTLFGFANHTLGIVDFQNLIQAILMVGVAWSTAHAAHNITKPDPKPQQ